MHSFISHLKSYTLSRVFRINLSALIIASLIPDSLNIRGYIENLHIKSQIESYWSKATLYHLIGGIGLIWLCLVLFGHAVKTFAERYRNSLRTTEPPLLLSDSLFGFVITLTLYVFLRIYTSPLAFLIVILVILIGWFLWWLLLQRRAKGRAAASTDLLSDNAIESPDEDLLGRKEFVENLYREITCIDFADSFVFGLSGSWGEGKTSVINLLKQIFKNNTDFLTVDFDPWYYKDEDAIIRGFYQEIERAIRREFIVSGLKKTIGKYLRKISPEVSPLGVKLKIPFDEESLDQIKKSIEEYISRTRKKILILVDDIDRLQPQEMLFVFKLVRLSARFKNTFFLLSYDELTVTKYLEEALHLDSDYLEKIIQRPISLPNIEQNKLDSFLSDRLDKFFEDIKIPNDEIEEFRNAFRPVYKQQIRRLFSNLRDTKRYLNGLLPAVPKLKGEIDLFDYCILEVIRIHFYSVYKDIGFHPWLYLKPDDDLWLSSPLKLSLKDSERRQQIKEHIESLVKQEKESEILLELLGALFEEVRISMSLGPSSRQRVDEIKAARRISNPQAFKKYFLLKVPQSNLSLAFVEERFEAWLSATGNTVEDLIKETFLEAKQEDVLSAFFKALMFTYIRRVTPDLAIAIIRALYKNSDGFAGKALESPWYSPKLEVFTELGWSLRLLMKLTNERLDEKKIQQMLAEVISNSPYIVFSAYVLNHCLRASEEEYYRVEKAIDLVKLKRLMLMRYLDEFVEKGKDIFDLEDEQDRGLLLYQWSYHAETNNERLILKGYILSLVKDSPKKYVKFLKHQVRSDYGRQLFMDIEGLDKVYGLSELIFLANIFKSDESLLTEEKTIIEHFLKEADARQNPKT